MSFRQPVSMLLKANGVRIGELAIKWGVTQGAAKMIADVIDGKKRLPDYDSVRQDIADILQTRCDGIQSDLEEAIAQKEN